MPQSTKESLDLACRLVANLTNQSSPSGDATRRLASTVLKFLAAFESISLPDNEAGTVDSIRFYLRSHPDRFHPGSSVRFDELCQKLAALRTDSTFRTKTLLLLLSLSRQRSKQSGTKRFELVAAPEPVPQKPVAKSIPREAKPVSHPKDIPTIDCLEAQLVHDVLYICQGIDGKTIKFNPRPTSSTLVLVDASIKISDPKRRLVFSLCEMGFLFNKVHSYVSSAGHHSIEGSTPEGMDIDAQSGCFTSQAFSYAINKELSEYYRLMAVLESRATGQLNDPDGPLTLRRLYVWLTEAIRKMRILAVLIDSISHLKGGALASALYAHSRTGNQFSHKFIMRLLRKVSVPVFDMIKTWVFEGEFTDPHGEFFIVDNVGTNLKSTQGFDLWRNGYSINKAMLPDFVSPLLAEKILRAGKTINFLRSRCGDVEWVQERASAAETTTNVCYTNLESLQDLAEEASSKVDLRLMEIITKKYRLPLHFQSLRRYILLGQGDFVQSLLDCLKPELDKEVNKISEAVVMGCIRAAIHSSNAMYDDEDVLDRVCVKRVAGFSSQSGWDVFSLDYRINPASPLATVIPPKTMNDYQQVFKLLWKLKKTELDLNECWRELKFISRSANRSDLGVGVRLKELLLIAFNVRTKLSHFCINFQYYIMFEVLEEAWNKFTAKADKASDLDALIQAHEGYIEAIISKCLLDQTPSAEALRLLLVDYFKLIDAFAKTVARLVGDTKQILLFLYARLRGDESNWTSDSRYKVDDVPPDYHHEMKAYYGAVLEKYDLFISSFTEKVSGESHIDLRFLMFRLDFEESSTSREVDAEAMISEELMQE